jgi:hypothetical protein
MAPRKIVVLFIILLSLALLADQGCVPQALPADDTNAAQPEEQSASAPAITSEPTSTLTPTKSVSLSSASGQTGNQDSGQAAPENSGKTVKAPVNANMEQKDQGRISLQKDDRLAPASAKGRHAVLQLLNNSGVEICYVHISSSSDNSWGEDQLADQVTIPAGGRYTFYLADGTYDLQALDCRQEPLDERYGIYLVGEKPWIIAPAGVSDSEEQGQAVNNEPAVTLDEFMCCGNSAGGTLVWSVRYPTGWKVQYIPDNPSDFTGVLISNPEGTITIAVIPSTMTPPGNAMDTGDVDEFLDAYYQQRRKENPGFTEFLRQPIPDTPQARIWSGTWGEGRDRMVASYLVALYPMQPWTPGLPRGYLTMYGLQASAAEWGQAVKIYDQMLASIQTKKVNGGVTADGESAAKAGGLATEPFLVRFCPYHCDWVAVDASRENWNCPQDGHETSLWEVPCVNQAGE